MPLRQLVPPPPLTPPGRGARGHVDTAKVDIFAVHGLNPLSKNDADHAWDTWRTPPGPKGRLWLRDDLPQYLPEARIFLYEYNSTAVFGRDKDNFIGKANELLEAVRIKRREAPDRPILFLGHSLGGLLIKQALINAHNNPKYQPIKDATTGLAFFATPHNGGDWKLLSLGSVVAKIAVATGFQQGDDILETLKSGSIFSDIMHELWRQQLMKYDIISFWGAYDNAVPRDSARLGMPGDRENVVKLNADHSSICKFGSSQTDQDNFEHVWANIEDIYKEALKKAKPVQVPIINQPAPQSWDGASPPVEGAYAPPQSNQGRVIKFRRPDGEERFLDDDRFFLRSNQPASQGWNNGASPPADGAYASPRPPISTPGTPQPPSVPSRFPPPPLGSTSPNPDGQRRFTGFLYSPTTPNDANSAKAADHKNAGRWEQARTLEQQMFEGYQSTLGVTHVSTLTAAVDLTLTTATLGYLADAERWVDWVIQIGAGTLGMKHPLLLKINRIKGEIMASKGQYAEAENLISGVLVDQQDLLGVDHLDTLETERALGDACQRMGRQQDAEARMRHRVETLTKRLGRDHVLVARALLDLFLTLIYPEITASSNTNNNSPWIPTVSGNRLQLEQAASSVGELHGRLKACLGAQHPLTIHALRVLGQAKAAQGQTTEASDMFRRALHNAEEVLGKDNPETLAIVCQIGLLYNKRDQEVAQVTAVQQVINRGSGAGGAPSSTARPWFERYADWLDRRVGLVIPATREVLCVLAMSYMAEQKLVEAEKYLERLVRAYQQDPKVANSPEAVQAANLLQSCRMNTMWMRGMGNGSVSGNDGGDLVGMLGRLGFYSDYSSSDGSNYLW